MQKGTETIWDYELQGYVRRKKLRAFLGGFGVGAAFTGFLGAMVGSVVKLSLSGTSVAVASGGIMKMAGKFTSKRYDEFENKSLEGYRQLKESRDSHYRHKPASQQELLAYRNKLDDDDFKNKLEKMHNRGSLVGIMAAASVGIGTLWMAVGQSATAQTQPKPVMTPPAP